MESIEESVKGIRALAKTQKCRKKKERQLRMLVQARAEIGESIQVLERELVEYTHAEALEDQLSTLEDSAKWEQVIRLGAPVIPTADIAGMSVEDFQSAPTARLLMYTSGRSKPFKVSGTAEVNNFEMVALPMRKCILRPYFGYRMPVVASAQVLLRYADLTWGDIVVTAGAVPWEWHADRAGADCRIIGFIEL